MATEQAFAYGRDTAHPNLNPQWMGTMIAAAEEMEMVERKRHPTDGRQMIIEWASRGAAVRSNV